MSEPSPPRVLVVAGSDSGAGAGLQADLKTVMALGGYATTVVTAVTAQDTLGVHGVWPLPAEAVLAQGRAVLDDIGADAVKTGMLGGAEVVRAAAELIDRSGAPAVVDPVMTAKGGAALLHDEGVAALLADLVPCTALLTPNAPEAAVLTGRPVETFADMERAAEALLRAGARAVLVKGGHLPGPVVRDVLASADGVVVFEAARIETRHAHGTGCTLASAIAVELARRRPLVEAVETARAYVRGALANAPGLGRGHGPMDHGWTLDRRDPRPPDGRSI